MSAFAVDHVVLRVPDPEGLAQQVSEAVGLPVLRGWTPDGVIRSRGVRFANGPFLDIHQADAPQPAWLGLRGAVVEAERIASRYGWRTRAADDGERFPWRILLFRRGQGPLSACFVIEYRTQDPAWAREEFSGALFRPAAGEGARLGRVTLASPEGDAVSGLADLLPAPLTVRSGASAEVAELEVSGASRALLRLTPDLSLRVCPSL